ECRVPGAESRRPSRHSVLGTRHFSKSSQPVGRSQQAGSHGALPSTTSDGQSVACINGQMLALMLAVLAQTSDGLDAWQRVYSVMVSPRCINCHTATNYPQQGDDRHRHVANVIRGAEGKGVAALNCATCHQSTNANSTGVPGAPNWHLAPLTMRW